MSLNIKQGEYYLTECNSIVRFDTALKEDDMYLNLNNRFYENEIIAEVPEQLLYEITRVINQYYNDDKFKTIIDNCYNRKGNNNGM